LQESSQEQQEKPESIWEKVQSYSHEYHTLSSSLDHISYRAKKLNQLCGDTIEVGWILKNDTLNEYYSVGQSCSLVQASSYLLSKILREKSPLEILQILNRLKEFLDSDGTVSNEVPPQFLFFQEVLRNYPHRKSCILLPIQTNLQILELKL
jgi:NifU-like protein involved in Fe-S cluster formation